MMYRKTTELEFTEKNSKIGMEIRQKDGRIVNEMKEVSYIGKNM